MDFLFDNPIANMAGVIFLIFYALFTVFALVVYRVWKAQTDQTDQLAMPPIPSKIDPYEIAFLRGGINELARSVTFSLRQKDFLIFENDGKSSRIHRSQYQNNSTNLLPIEQAARDWFTVSREPKELFQTGGLIDTLQPFAETYEARLEQLQFLHDLAMKRRNSKARMILHAAIAGLGAFKFAVAVLSGYSNVIGIFVIGIAGLIIAFKISKLPRLTKLGKAYLERLQLAFSQLKMPTASAAFQTAAVQPRAVQSGATFTGIDPMLLGVGVFGSAVLAGTIYDDYNTAFQRAQNQASAGGCGGSSGCGTSCGSTSSSGDSGGSSCGGGCGGCGGGD